MDERPVWISEEGAVDPEGMLEFVEAMDNLGAERISARAVTLHEDGTVEHTEVWRNELGGIETTTHYHFPQPDPWYRRLAWKLVEKVFLKQR